MIEWFLVELKDGQMPRWCQIMARRRAVQGGEDSIDTVWVDGRGISHERTGQPVLMHVEALRDRDIITDARAARIEIPMAARLLLKPDSESGWVSPDGRFWGCSSVNHEWLLASLLRQGAHQVAELGWVRMCGDHLFYGRMTGPGGEHYGGAPLTAAQIDTLFDLGFVDISTGQWPHKRVWQERREEANRLRPFAVRTADVDAMVDRLVRNHCTRPEPVQASHEELGLDSAGALGPA